MGKMFFWISLVSVLVTSAWGADVTIYIKNNAPATNISDIIILGRRGGSGEWTTLWGGQKSSRNAKDISFGYGELRRFVFKDLGMTDFQIRYTVKQGELNLVETYWDGFLSEGSIFVMECPGGRCSLTKQPVFVPKEDVFKNY